MSGNLRDEIQKVYDHEGRLTPALVVEAARPKGSPLHNHFEWDDKIAGPKYRLVQAREMIQSFQLVYKETKAGPRTVRQWIAVRDEQGHTYQPAEKVAADPMTRELVLREAERALFELKRKYGHLKEFFALVHKVMDEEGDQAA